MPPKKSQARYRPRNRPPTKKSGKHRKVATARKQPIKRVTPKLVTQQPHSPPLTPTPLAETFQETTYNVPSFSMAPPPMFTDSEKEELINGLRSLTKITTSVSLSSLLHSLDSAYTSLAVVSKPVLMDQIRSWWSQSQSSLETFQQLLRSTKDWAGGNVNTLFERLGHPEYIERLLDLAAVIEQKVLYLSLNMSAKVIKLPDSRRLFHSFLKVTAQHLFLNPFLAKSMCEDHPPHMATSIESFLKLAKAHWQSVIFEAVSKTALLSPSPLLGELNSEPARPPPVIQQQPFTVPQPSLSFPPLPPPSYLSMPTSGTINEQDIGQPQVRMMGLETPDSPPLGPVSVPSPPKQELSPSVVDSDLDSSSVSGSSESDESSGSDVSSSEASSDQSGSTDSETSDEGSDFDESDTKREDLKGLQLPAPPLAASNQF